MMTYEGFAARVRAAGLASRECQPNHWQIRGGPNLVNVWPHARRGFVFHVQGRKSRQGSLEEAIKAAGKPLNEWRSEIVLKPREPEAVAPWEGQPKTAERVGVIRRFWRWFW